MVMSRSERMRRGHGAIIKKARNRSQRGDFASVRCVVRGGVEPLTFRFSGWRVGLAD